MTHDNVAENLYKISSWIFSITYTTHLERLRLFSRSPFAIFAMIFYALRQIHFISTLDNKIEQYLTRVGSNCLSKIKSSFCQMYLFSKSSVNYFIYEYFMAIIVKFEEKTSKWISDRSFDLFLFFHNTQKLFCEKYLFPSSYKWNGKWNNSTVIKYRNKVELDTFKHRYCKLRN